MSESSEYWYLQFVSSSFSCISISSRTSNSSSLPAIIGSSSSSSSTCSTSSSVMLGRFLDISNVIHFVLLYPVRGGHSNLPVAARGKNRDTCYRTNMPAYYCFDRN
ncbi:hypothetical protein EMCRGX_G002229 [Ephydatia muelleri]